jgi:hypothetical protein
MLKLEEETLKIDILQGSKPKFYVAYAAICEENFSAADEGKYSFQRFLIKMYHCHKNLSNILVIFK